jgi:hypothetical protein
MHLVRASINLSSDTANASNPFPNAGNVSTTALADRCPDVSVPLNDITNTLPDLLAPVASQFRSEHIIAELSN